MTISSKDWIAFVDRLSQVSTRAALELRRWVNAQGGYAAMDRQVLIDYVYALATKYGEGTGALAAAWYDALAEASGKYLPAAEVSATAGYGEVAKTVNGVLKQSRNEELLAGAVERLVKMPGVDTTLRNAIRDGAEVAWIPHGDTCAFCIALASRGWERAGRNTLRNGHAEHIHANCDCTYAVRFDSSTEVAGYDEDRYREMYYGAEGRTPRERINAMRREFYAENRAEIREQQNSAYEKRVELNSSAAEEADV